MSLLQGFLQCAKIFQISGKVAGAGVLPQGGRHGLALGCRIIGIKIMAQGCQFPVDVYKRQGLGWARRDWHSLDLALQRAGYDMRLAAEAGLVGRSDRGSVYDRFRGRLIFPIKNLSNQVIAFGGRIIADEDEAKYINSSDTPIYKKGEHLYGLAQARKGITVKGRALLTEGYMDVLTLHQFGYDNAVGVLGTALTPDQIKRLSGFTSQLTLLFDGDRAGRKAALRSCEMLLTRGLACTVVLMPCLLYTSRPSASRPWACAWP